MGDIEKYGTGFIRIRKFLEGYPEVTLKIYEIGDYFKAVLTSSVSEKIKTGQAQDNSVFCGNLQ